MIYRERRGITLIEIIVIIGIMSLLALLVIPAVQAAREASRRAICASNLRQIGLAIQLYHDQLNSLPPGRQKGISSSDKRPDVHCANMIAGESLQIRLLPFIEGTTILNCYNFTQSVFSESNTTVRSTSVACYACPSDYTSGYARTAWSSRTGGDLQKTYDTVFTSYAGCTGSFMVLSLPMPRNQCLPSGLAVTQNNGVFNDVSPITFATVLDGLAHTVAIMEHSTANLKNLRPAQARYFERFGWFISGNWGDTLATAFYPPNAHLNMHAISSEAGLYSSNSLHTGGLNLLFCDGSVHYIKDTINTWPHDRFTLRPVGVRQEEDGAWLNAPAGGIWQSIATRSGGESIGIP